MKKEKNKSKPIKVAICGAMGKMGQQIIKTIHQKQKMKTVTAIEKENTKHRGKNIGKLLNLEKISTKITPSNKAKKELKKTKPSVLVDFTTPKATIKNTKKAAKLGIPIIIGTTGFTKEQKEKIKKTIKESNIPALISSNMALGVNVFFKLVKKAAKTLSDYDMEIIEAHHNQKIDSPSGTAITTAKTAAKASGKDLEKNAKYGRKKGKTGKRPENEIGIHSIRGGDISGDHTFLLAGPSERLEITHRAQDRQVFANGTIKAIEYITKHGEKGKIYDMQDILLD